jgi:hypothetical protein
MRIRQARIAVLATVSMIASAYPTQAQSNQETHIWLEPVGSVPPIPQWTSCIEELKNKPYDETQSQECLDSILSHPGIQGGSIKLERHKKESWLTFQIQSPPLILTDVDLGIDASDLAKVHELLAINGHALRPGGAYDWHGESSTWLVLDLLFRSQGRRTGVSRTLHLDYNKKRAQVVYKIWEGPPGDPERLVPPYATPCPILNGNFSWVDADDFTPLDYVRRQMKIKWLDCFSEKDLEEDRDTLKRMAFLKDSKISVTGSGESRNFTFYYRSNPIPIMKVSVHGYGLLAGLPEVGQSTMLIHPGDTYSRTLAQQQEDSLKKQYKRDNWQIKAFTDVQVDATGKATLDFSVLAYADHVVYVNDEAYDVPVHDKE